MSEGGSVVLAGLRYALGESDSWALKSYAVVGALCAVFTGLLVLLAFPQWILETDTGALNRVGRAFLGLLGLLLVAAMVAPLVFVHRRRTSDRPGRDRLFGVAGFAYLLSLYVALLVSAPEGLRDDPGGVLAPVVEFLYGLPPQYGVLAPLVGVLFVVGVEYGLD